MNQKQAENPMRKIFIEKMVLSCGAIDQDLQKAQKLLHFLTKSKPQIVSSRKRIPAFNVRPGLEVGTCVTLRKKKAIPLLKQLLGAIENKLRKKQIAKNHFSFGIAEYIEIPGVEYQRDIGVRGLNITVDFARKGLRVKRKKIKKGKVSKKQHITPEEIAEFMKQNFQTEVI